MPQVTTGTKYDARYEQDLVRINACSETLARTALYTFTYGAGSKTRAPLKKAATGVIGPADPMDLPAELDVPALAAASPGCLLLLKGSVKAKWETGETGAQSSAAGDTPPGGTPA